MTKTKKLMFLAAAMIAAGLVLFGIGMVLGGKPGFLVDAKGFHTFNSYSTAPHSLEKTKLNKFTSLEVNTEDASIEIIPSDDYYIEYYTSEGYAEPAYSVVNNHLKFSEIPSRRFLFTYLDYTIPSSAKDYYVKIYVPADTLMDTINLTTENGEIILADMQTDTISLDNEYGNITGGKLTASKCSIITENGSITVDELQADRFEINNDYGNISVGTINGSKGDIIAEEGQFTADLVKLDSFTLNNDYGDVTIKTLDAVSSDIILENGNLSVGVGKITKLQAENDYGEVSLALSEDLAAYNTDLYTEYGVIILPDNSSTSSHSDGATYTSQAGKGKTITVKCENGDISLTK